MHEVVVIQQSSRGSNNNNIPVELKVLLFQEWKYNAPVARAWSISTFDQMCSAGDQFVIRAAFDQLHSS